MMRASARRVKSSIFLGNRDVQLGGKKTVQDGEGGREMAGTGATLRSSWEMGEDWVPF